jgi:hypothetical protein
MYSYNVRKAFKEGKGDAGDINLALIAALRAADLGADPVVLSTRANGFPEELHPVLTDFNYVIARVEISGKVYLLDATDNLLPFGLIPEKCLNGKGRWLDDIDSQWIKLEAPASEKSVTMMTMKVFPDGKLTGSLATSYFGYAAINERKALAEAANEKEYANGKTRGYNLSSISDAVYENTKDVDKPFVVKYNFETEAFDAPNASQWLFNPFFASPWKENPFTAAQRFHPIEIGVPIEQRMIITIELPEGSVVQSLPENAGIALPDSGGKYLFQAKAEGNKVSMTSNFSVTRAQFDASEYQILKEFFARMIQTQATDIVITSR